MIDDAPDERIPAGWQLLTPLVPVVRALERHLLLSSIEQADAEVARALAEQARLYALAARCAEREDEREGTLEQEWALRSWKAEIAAITNTSRQAVTGVMHRSRLLVDAFPIVHEALTRGETSMAHARVICETGLGIEHDDPAEQAARRELFARACLERARATSPGRVRDFAGTLVEKLTSASLAQRFERAMRGRGVQLTTEPDSMACLQVRHSLLVLTAIDGRLSDLAKAVIAARSDGSDDRRSFHEVRADVFAELLLTGDLGTCPEAADIRAHVSITIPALTLLSHETATGAEPATLDGRAPIPAHLAKELAAGASVFERILTHPVTGTVVEVDRYRPTEAMRSWLRARDQHCRFPGCRLVAERCDLDHTLPAAEGGPTRLTNLAALCRWHHTVKGNTAWKVRQLDGGILEWTSPSGQQLHDVPDPRGVVFVPAPSSPPPPPPPPPPRDTTRTSASGEDASGEGTANLPETGDQETGEHETGGHETGEQRLARR